MAISSAGIGSGLDVNSIVSQLVALEKQPLKPLQLKATTLQAQVSAFGQVQSQFAALTDVATRIADPNSWTARVASSSNTSAATITATNAASATTFSLDVDALALKQSASSAAIAPGTMPGAGTLTFQLGTWTGAGATFAPGTSASVAVTVGVTDTLATIAGKINAANTGVVASVFNDGVNQRLLFQSSATGVAAGFRVQSADAPLAGLVFDPQNKPGVGMAAAGIPVQYGQDAKARINGLAVTSATNTLDGNFAGVTITLAATTTTSYGLPGEVKNPVTMAIRQDVTPSVKNVQDFATAYNTLAKSLADLTRYDATTKTSGLFQGDPAIVGLQNVLNRMLGSISQGATSQRLADVGLIKQRDGTINIDTTKLSVAANNGTSLQQLFTNNNQNPLINGFALKFRDLGQGVALRGGSVFNEAASLQKQITSNSLDQTKVNNRAALFEARLRKQYSALDVQMAGLTSLNAYVAQQVVAWNKSAR